MKQLVKLHYTNSIFSYFLLPISFIYLLIITFRKLFYKIKLFKSHKLPVPVIVVGNITLGGTGKTPLVIYLAELLKSQGLKPGIISRGYGGKAPTYPFSVTATSNPKEAGDEPVLIATRTQCPMIVDPNRPRAAHYLLKHFDCDVIISDDGLQHYALDRDVEIVVIDAQRRFGNGLLFPAGPLRELQWRLKSVDFIVANGPGKDNEYSMELVTDEICHVKDSQKTISIHELKQQQVHAVAGIGDPTRFFETLKSLGLTIIEHPFSDHYCYTKQALNFNSNSPIIMTEKDAVKCRDFAGDDFWYLPVHAELNNEFHFSAYIRARLAFKVLPKT